MVLEFKVENFRSFKHEQVFSFVAEATKSKPHNVFDVPLPKGNDVRLLKSAVVYGANASGKSNFLKALGILRHLVVDSRKFEMNQNIYFFDPFRLDKTSRTQPTKFDITFLIGNETRIKYHYSLAYNYKEIVSESLDFYPNGQVANLYKRKKTDNLYDEIDMGKALKKMGVPKRFLKNQLILSKFATEPHEQMYPIFKFFDNIFVFDSSSDTDVKMKINSLKDALFEPQNINLKNSVIKLIKAFDTQIEDIVEDNLDKKDADFINQMLVQKSDEYIKSLLLEEKQLKARHKIYENGVEVGTEDLDFSASESVGTNMILLLGFAFLQKFESGGLIVIDELDNSLHPKVSRFFLQLLHNELINKANAQFLFSTHEPILMDKNMFRSDQIWFCQKNKYGESEMYSAQDFEGVREDIAFDKWYMSGKFGALPHIKESVFMP